MLYQNKEVSLGEFMDKNNFSLINIWASWCSPCRNEHSYLINLKKNKKINVIGINYKDKEINAKNFLEDLGNPYSSIAKDKRGKIAIDWGVYGIPETFVVNSKGIIKYRHVGPITHKEYKKINLLIEKIK